MSHAASAATIRVGTDLVSASDVASSIAVFGDRYVGRIYTAQEARTCTGTDGRPAADRLAARFAAKEAVVKALRPTGGIDHREIEIRHADDGSPECLLTGAMHDHAEAVGLYDSSLSLTHDAGFASAVFVAVLATPALTTPPDHLHESEEDDVR